MSIERWDETWHDDEFYDGMGRMRSGRYVTYADHRAAMKDLEDERENLYTMGQLADLIEGSYEKGRAEGYARGLIEGDHGGRREGYRSGYAAGKNDVMTASYAQEAIRAWGEKS